ncbi:Transcription elongation factor spt6 [Allomyces javanicus]|nr:Transcription elongation factor spt6 [Allomyces javanicus]
MADHDGAATPARRGRGPLSDSDDDMGEPTMRDVDMEDSEEEPEDIDEETEADRGFIADDDEDDDAPARMPAADDDRDVRKRRKKRKKVVEEEELDDDDLDLVEENTGLKVKESRNFKRLKKRKDREEEEDYGYQRRAPNNDVANIFDDVPEDYDLPEDDFIVDDEVPEEEQVYRKAQERERNRSRYYQTDQVVSEQALDDMHAIFGDGTEYDWAIELQDRDRRPVDDDYVRDQDQQDIKLTDVFEPSEVVEKMLTDKDEEVRVTDIPERMQELGIRRADPAQLDESVDWCTQAVLRSRRLADDDPHGAVAIREAVQTVLNLLRQEFLEVPFILYHRRDYFRPALNDEELWLIADADEEHRSFFQKRRALFSKYERLQYEDPAFLDAFYTIRTLRHIADLSDYLNFKHAKRLAQVLQTEQAAAGHRQPVKSDPNDVFRTESVDYLIHLFCLPEPLLVENLRARTQLHIAPSPYTTLSEEMARATPSGVDVKRFQAALIKYLASTLFHNPEVRLFYATEFEASATISVIPTDVGKKEIDAAHPFYYFKYVANKPIATLQNAQFLDYLEAEAKGLVTLDISFAQQHLVSSRLSNAWVTSSTDEWNACRIQILKATETMLFEHATATLREELLRRAQSYVARECSSKLLEAVMVAPAMSTRPDDRDRDNFLPQYARVLALCLVQQHRSYKVFGAVVDSRGEMLDVYTDEFNLPELAKTIGRYDPERIVVGLCTNFYAFRLVQAVKEVAQGYNLPVDVLSDNVALAYQESAAAIKEFPDHSVPVRHCIGLARQRQDPAHVAAALFPKDVLKVQLHRQQAQIPEELLLQHLERTMVKCVMVMGVDINEAFDCPHYSHTLQFVAGLGPRKASGLYNKMLTVGHLTSRQNLILSKCMGRRVFMNSASFIRITIGFVDDRTGDPLDDTRIHPEDYALGRKMVADALDVDEVDDRDPNVLSKRIRDMWARRRQHVLDELRLEAYADMLLQEMNLKKFETLHIIKEELKSPYKEQRPPLHHPGPEELLEKVLGSRPQENVLVKATVTQVRDKIVRLRLPNGMDAIMWPRCVSQDRDFRDAIKQGQEIEGVVMQVDMERVCLTLSMLPQDMQIAREPSQYSNTIDQYFDRDRARKDDELQRARERAEQLFAATTNPAAATGPVMIKHPLFKPFNAQQATTYLAKRNPGEAVIRFSSRGEGRLTISWHVVQGIVQHLEVVQDAYSKQYRIENARSSGSGVAHGYGHQHVADVYYDDLDEILFRYVEACSTQVAKVTKHRKYVGGPRDDLERKLTRDIKADPNVVAYGICPNPEFPGWFYLLYLHQLGRPSELGFKVVPRGFVFLGREYHDVEDVINAFKNSFRQMR